MLTATRAGVTGTSPFRSAEFFPDPFADYASTVVPENVSDMLRWCLVPGTPIELADFSIVPVETVRPGMMVMTRGGTVERVVAASARPVEEEIVELCFSGRGRQLALRLTGNHQVWRIKTPKRKPGLVRPETLPTEKVPAAEIQVGDYFATPLPARPSVMRPSRFLGYVFGMYLAEGCPFGSQGRYQGVRFNCGQDDEASGVLAKLRNELEWTLGELPPEIYTPPSRPDVRLLTTCDVELPDWLVEHGGKYAEHKALSYDVLGFDDESLLEMLGGWIDGDGWISQQASKLKSKAGQPQFNGAAGHTNSFVLAQQLQRVAHCLGLTPSLCRVRADRGFASDPNAVGYVLRFGKADCDRLADHSVKLANARKHFPDFALTQAQPRSVFIANGYVYRRVTHVKRADYKGLVHNFEVENDHSYIAGGVIVANCEFIMMKNGIYREAVSRKLAYFVTDLEVGGEDLSREEREKRRDFYDTKLDIKNDILVAGRNFETYGNDFASLHVPFRRSLSCPKCGTEWPLRTVVNTPAFSFSWTDYEFHATCPVCATGSGYTGKFLHVDRRGGEESKVRVKHWNPHEMEIIYDVFSHETGYVWKIPAEYKDAVRRGVLKTLENAPIEVIQAVKHDNSFLFDDDVIYHMKDEALAGIRNRGWGIPRIITNFSQAWYVQVLHRYNEAIALDYVVPFRVITPASRGGAADPASSDPVLGMNLGSFTARTQAMLRNRRRNPTAFNVMPFPIEYQALGGEANQLAPKDLLDQGIDNLLSSAGVPPSMYKMDLTAANAPPALRLFEVCNSPLVHNLNGYLRWLDKALAAQFGWEPADVKWRKVTFADDAQRQMAQLQLMMGRQISQTTGLKSLGLDFEDEQRGMLEEEKFVAEETQRIQEEQAESGQQQGGQPPAGGQAAPAGGDPGAQGGDPNAAAGGGAAPAGGGGGAAGGGQGKVDPVQLQAQSMEIAKQLLAMPDAQRTSELISLKNTDSTLHAIVKSQIESLRQDAARQGSEQVLQQQLGKQGIYIPRNLMGRLPRRPRLIDLD